MFVSFKRSINLQANRVGRVDCFIQSCDKNLMVPVGGAVLASHNKEFPAKVAATYAGRGSSTPALDITITLLEMGVEGWNKLMKERKVIRVM